MLTPDQTRLRLDAIRYHESDNGAADLVTLLYDVLPDLVALASGRSHDDAAIREARAQGYCRGYDVATARAESRTDVGLPLD